MWGPCGGLQRNTAQINLARTCTILASGRMVDHVSPPISVVLSVAFQTSAIIFPVSYQAPSSLQLGFASLPAKQSSCSHSLPRGEQKQAAPLLSRPAGAVTTEPPMLCSPHAAPASTGQKKPRWSPVQPPPLPSSQPAALKTPDLFFSFFFDCP